METQNLPQLTGSEKQIAWATSIRFGYIDVLQIAIKKADRMIDDSYVDKMRERLAEVLPKTDAKYWIENRFEIENDNGNLKSAIQYVDDLAKEIEADM